MPSSVIVVSKSFGLAMGSWRKIGPADMARRGRDEEDLAVLHPGLLDPEFVLFACGSSLVSCFQKASDGAQKTTRPRSVHRVTLGGCFDEPRALSGHGNPRT